MTLTVLLVLAAVASPGAGARTVPGRIPSDPGAFRVAPLRPAPTPYTPFALRSPLGPAPLLAPPRIGARRDVRHPDAVTCTLRIVRVPPSMDPGILLELPPAEHHPDPIVRDDLSPCTEVPRP